MAHGTDGRKQGERGPTLKDVARAAGVHASTVSRALDPGKMSLVQDETREHVRRVAERLGYRADVVARSLRRRQTTAVGVVMTDLGNPVFAPVLRGISSASRAPASSISSRRHRMTTNASASRSTSCSGAASTP